MKIFFNNDFYLKIPASQIKFSTKYLITIFCHLNFIESYTVSNHVEDSWKSLTSLIQVGHVCRQAEPKSAKPPPPRAAWPWVLARVSSWVRGLGAPRYLVHDKKAKYFRSLEARGPVISSRPIRSQSSRCDIARARSTWRTLCITRHSGPSRSRSSWKVLRPCPASWSFSAVRLCRRRAPRPIRVAALSGERFSLLGPWRSSYLYF